MGAAVVNGWIPHGCLDNGPDARSPEGHLHAGTRMNLRIGGEYKSGMVILERESGRSEASGADAFHGGDALRRPAQGGWSWPSIAPPGPPRYYAQSRRDPSRQQHDGSDTRHWHSSIMFKIKARLRIVSALHRDLPLLSALCVRCGMPLQVR